MNVDCLTAHAADLRLLGTTLFGTHTPESSFYEAAYGLTGQELAAVLAADAARFPLAVPDSIAEQQAQGLEAVAARAPTISYGEWKRADIRRHELRQLWHDFLTVTPPPPPAPTATVR